MTKHRPPAVAATRLCPAILPGRAAFHLAVVLLSALAGASMTAAALRGNTLSEHPASAPCTASAAADPNDQHAPQNRLHNAAGYVRRWDTQVGPDGIAQVRSEELRSCYNLLTLGELPPSGAPPAPHAE